jgi:importin-5
MRTFSLVLLRRLLFRELSIQNQTRSPSPSPTGHNSLYDHLSEGTRCSLEKLVLSCLTHEERESVRRKCTDTVSDIALGSFERGRDWEGLRIWIGEACSRGGLAMRWDLYSIDNHFLNEIFRESSYSILSNVSALLHDIPLDTLLPLLQSGLQLPNTPPTHQEIACTYAAFQAACTYLRTTQDPTILSHSNTLLVSSLSLLPRLPLAELPRFLAVLTNGLIPVHPALFGVHLGDLLGFFAPMLLPTIGEDPITAKPVDFDGDSRGGGGRGLETPTTGARGVFTFPPPSARGERKGSISNGRNATGGRGRSRDGDGEDSEDEETTVPENSSAARLAILELMLTLTESKPSLVKRAGEVGSAWVRAIVRGCLEGLAEIRGSTKRWLRAVPGSGEIGGEGDEGELERDPTSVFEQALDRLSIALSTSGLGTNGNVSQSGQAQSVLAVAFTYIPAMLVHSSWKVRHAGLMGIACLAEGGRREMGKESGKVVGLVLPLFSDAHPRVRWAACQCMWVHSAFYDDPLLRFRLFSGQLCTDLEELIEEEYYDQIIKVLIPALEAPEPR